MLQGAYLASLYKAKKEMSKLLARLAGYMSNRTLVGVDKVGNRYFTRTEEIDGISKWGSPLPVLNLFLFFALFFY